LGNDLALVGQLVAIDLEDSPNFKFYLVFKDNLKCLSEFEVMLEV